MQQHFSKYNIKKKDYLPNSRTAQSTRLEAKIFSFLLQKKEEKKKFNVLI